MRVLGNGRVFFELCRHAQTEVSGDRTSLPSARNLIVFCALYFTNADLLQTSQAPEPCPAIQSMYVGLTMAATSVCSCIEPDGSNQEPQGEHERSNT